MDFTQFINAFIAILVISNPLSALPAILKITRNQTLAAKRKTGLIASFAVLVILLVATWAGNPLLLVLGIKLPAFQVAGGVIIFMMAMAMLSAEDSPIQHPTGEEKPTPREEAGAIVPLAIPIIAGPGSISTIIVHVNTFPGVLNLLILSAAVILVSFVMGLLLYFSSALERMLGPSKIGIINRLGGLILAAIAVQTLTAGLTGLFPVLAVR